jgi:hypothetical protein
MVWAAITAFLLTLVSRLAYLRGFSFNLIDKDVSCHLYLVRSIRENQGCIRKTYTQFLLDDNTYPQAFHKWVALAGFSLPFLERWGGVIPIVFDCLLLLFIAWVLQLNHAAHFGWLLLFPLIRLLWAVEDRAFLFNPRAFGDFWANVYLGSAFMAAETHQWPWLILASVSFLVFSTSSKFAWQAVVFFTLLLSLVLWRPDLWVVFGLSLLISAILSGGYNLKVLKGLIIHSYVYKTVVMKVSWGFKNYYRSWLEVFHRTNSRRLLFHFFHHNPLAKMVTQYPIIIPFLVIVVQQGFPFSSWVLYALTGPLLVFIIALEPLKFLGEPERYLEFSILPIFVTLSQYPVKEHWVGFSLAVCMGLISVWLQIILKREEKPKLVKEDYARFLDALRELPDSVILTIPHRTSMRLAFDVPEKHRYAATFLNVGLGRFYEGYKALYPDYTGYPANNLAKLISHYNVNYVVLNKNSLYFLNKITKGQPYYEFSQFSTVFDSPNYTIFKPLPRLTEMQEHA